MPWLYALCALLFLALVALVVKIALDHRALDEIRGEMSAKLDIDTNTLISVSSGDRHIRRLADDLNGQLRLLRDERRRLQTGDMELKQAITNISHDLRTPLTVICGYLDVLENEEMSDKTRRSITIIRERAEALRELTQELFSYAMVVSKATDMRLEKVNITGLLEQSLAAFYAVFTKRGIVPVVNAPKSAIYRTLDRAALMRVYENILFNALKYSNGDLHVTLFENARITFANSAPELDEIQVGRLFDRFYSVESASGSTGLGLAIAKTLIEQMGGSITASYSGETLTIVVALADD